ncbi:class II aldolase/adducin family protein [Candidatus Woesearchaeota archaeon]|nr:class II aldolase/adducin family protein [Candidatus Woesearchaeota archaeon]
MDEGYIKFNCEWIKKHIQFDDTEINRWRSLLYEKGFIGMYDNGIGFGNISIRSDKGFIITGSATGYFPKLEKKHYAEIIEYNFEKNYVKCIGETKASSESLTHAAVYEADPSANAVIHIHSLNLWKKLLNNVPTTKKAPYGTPEMAHEIMRLIRETGAREKKIIVMSGHEEGIISFGKDLREAGEIILGFLY